MNPSHRSTHPAYRLTVDGGILSRQSLLLWLREFFRTSNMDQGYALEFGVLNGESMAEIWRVLRGPLARIYGFDSFEGLPEASVSQDAIREFAPAFVAGNYRSVGKEHVERFLIGAGVPQESSFLIPGFFMDSLSACDMSVFSRDPGGCLLVHVDCDLYESVLPVFDFIEPLLQTGTWILFDDYWCFRGSPYMGVRRAIDEWVKKNGKWGLSDYTNYGGYGKAFIVHEIQP